MDFPVRLNVAEIGLVSAAVDGFELKSISALEVKENLHSVLSDKVLTWLASKGDEDITIEQFKAHGISLTLQPQDLTIEMSLAESAMATDSLTYGKDRHFELPKGEAKWAILNNLNLNHERSDNNRTEHTQFEWLMNANIGGADGLNVRSSAFWESGDNGDNQDSHFYRGDTFAFYDRPDLPMRFTLGDTQVTNSGHLSGTQLAGLGIEKAYSKLQPQRRITPSNSQQFVLPRAATLEVFINEFLISRLRLRAGRYNLSDLPLTSGVNNIHVVARYANGETQDFHFATHYNARLLAPGLSDYSLKVGYVSSLDNGHYEYDDELLVSGNYEYGFNDKLTLGLNGAIHPQGHVLGSIVTLGSPFGNISLRYSQSEMSEQTGEAFSIETEHSIFGNGNYGSPNLRLGYELKRNFTNTPWQTFNTIADNSRAFFDYSYIIDDYSDFNLNATRTVNDNNVASENASASFNFRYEDMRLKVGFNHNSSDDPRVISENQFVLNFTWNGYDRDAHTRTRAQYNSSTKVASASYAKTNNNFLNDYGYELRAEKGSNYRQEQVRASYTGAFFRADVNATNYTRSNVSADSSVGINLSTSLGVADGHLGMGATTTAPFAVVTKHKTLKNTDVLVNVDRLGRAQTKPNNAIGALINLGSGYTNTQFNIDVPEAPLGYDWGPGMYLITGGANTGHHIQVGSDLSYTVIGTLVDAKGTAIAMQRGHVIKRRNNDDGATQTLRRAFFTNRTGRFVVEGISVGDYIIELDDAKGAFSITDVENRFIRIGTIKLEQTQLKGDLKE
ncbi:fimbria/pilus outer membrane usher protein [Pseudoalteromonas sp. S16_S37]|uniref:fimbria/pilus outer membrane usher protein n=1 Tax=Pseudoalteromonas sp. S16_S37 TaxID=2720228 RepID=UPI001680D4BD|nr:fimbria/pilus outer membrane usher protein [Pseudoalteromonas sp. S16_S37]MBD1581093.1 fimbria/pilus outer membrane usher protein [Pseudoalteromonas sp. S16_S37]